MTVGVAVADQPPVIAIPLAVAAGIIAGGAWGFIPGILKAVSGAHEVVTTIMLNYVAISILAWAVSGPLKVPGSPSPITHDVGNAAFPILIGDNGHLGIIIALAMVFAVRWLLQRTTLGFEIRTVGANPDAARYAGMRPKRLIILTMSMCGALAGLAGTCIVLGVTHEMTSSFGTTVGFDAIAVALLARSNPVGIIFSGLLFGAMRAGAGLMQIDAGDPARADRRHPGHDPALPGHRSRPDPRVPPPGRERQPRGDRDDHPLVRTRGGLLMDQLINALYAIPVLGFLFQFAGYLIEVLPQNAPIILQSATPIVLAALCGVMCERSGVVNIGIEGMMLTAAFVGWIVGVVLAPVLPADPSPFFGMTPAARDRVRPARSCPAVGVALLHAWLSISVRADQIISGTIINIAAAGLTAYLYTIVSAGSPESAGYFPPFVPPTQLTDLPVIGWILAMFLNQGPIAMSVIVIVIGFQIWLFRSRWGLRSRAVGEHPKAAETVGIDVIRLRYRNVLYGGVLAGLAGAYLSMEASNSFQAGMTGGRGFIGLAAMIVGRWTPVGAFGAALLFSSSQALGQIIKFAPPSGELGTSLLSIPGQFYDALPYLVTIVVLAGFVGRSIPPAADGQPYEREAAT